MANWIASGSADKTIVLWDAETGSELSRLTGHGKDVYSVAFSPDGRWLYSGSVDKTIRVWGLDVTDAEWQPVSAAWQAAEEDAHAEEVALAQAEQQRLESASTPKFWGRLFGGKR